LSDVRQDIRIRFSKQGDIRFISHHDLMRLFERAVRRADLPVAVSGGHNPRPRISLPMALALGLAGRNEVADIVLARWVRPDEVRSRLQAELPSGIDILSAEVIPSSASRQPQELAYLVPLLPGSGLTEARLAELLARDSVVVERTRKDQTFPVDVRPFVKALRLGSGHLQMLLSYTDKGTARPQEVLQALGCREAHDYRASAIERTHVRIQSSV